MSRLLPLVLLLAAAIAGWWLLRTGDPPAAEPGASAPLMPGDASPQLADTPPAPVAFADASAPPTATSALAAPTAPGAASLTLTDNTGRSLWLADDRLTLWRMDATPPRAVASQLTTAADAQLVGELPAGRYRAAVGHHTLGRVVSQDFDVRGGETASVALPSGVPDAARRVTLRLEPDETDFPLDGCVSVLVADGESAPRPALRLAESLYAADDIGPRGCDVSVTWFREPPVHLRDLTGGSVQAVPLRGSARLLVTCYDDQHRTIPATTVSLRLPGDAPDVRRTSAGTDDDGRASFEALPACDLIVQVVGDWVEDTHRTNRRSDARMSGTLGTRNGPDQPRALLVLRDFRDVGLSPGTTTSRDVQLEMGTSLLGEVRYASGEPAAATVIVLAHREPPRALAIAPAIAPLVARLETDGWRACAVSATYGFDSQRTEFYCPGVPAGALRLVAGVSADWFGAPVDIDATPGVRLIGLSVSLPPARWIRGRLLAPAGADMSGLSVGTKIQQGEHCSDVAADGTFKLGPLDPGRYALGLKSASPADDMVSFEDWRWLPGQPPNLDVSLGSVELPADRDVERNFDLRASAPGALDVHVNVVGPVKKDFAVLAVTPDGSFALGADAIEKGLAHLDHLFSRQVRLVLAADGWVDPRPELVDVPAWGRASVELSLHVFEGVVCVQSADGKPLASGAVHFGRLAESGWIAAPLVVLDAQGCLHVASPAGKLWFSSRESHPGSDDSMATLRWPAEGEQPAVVTLRD